MTQYMPLPPRPRIKRRPQLILGLLLAASFTLAVDFSILNVALPTVGAAVGLSLHNLQWVATLFALCAAGFTLLFGRVADLVGRRRVFLLGMGLLGVASLVGGLANTPAVLLAARGAQGLATAAVTPAALSLLTTTFPEGRRREHALGLNGAVMAAGFTTGAILGGVLTDLLSWRWAFFINVAVAAVVLALAPLVLVESRPEARPRLDVPGAVTVTAALIAIVYGLTHAGATSFANPTTLGALILGLVALGSFLVVEQRVREPLVPLGILKTRRVAWGNLAGMLAFATETSLVFLLTLYLQRSLGYSPLGAGLSFAVLGAGTVLGGLLGPRMVAAVGERRALIGGLTAQAVSTAPLILLGLGSSSMGLLLPATFVGGIANMVSIVAFMVTATSGVPHHQQGAATGLASLSQQIGITLGIPVMSAIAGARIHTLGAPSAAHVLSGVTLAIAVNAALCLVAAAALWMFLRTRAEALASPPRWARL